MKRTERNLQKIEGMNKVTSKSPFQKKLQKLQLGLLMTTLFLGVTTHTD